MLEGAAPFSAITSVALIIGLLNVVLLFALIFSYWKTYKEVKSEFTIGLLFFASFLLLQNIASSLFLILQLLFAPNIPSISDINKPHIPLLIINFIQLIALFFLFKITRK